MAPITADGSIKVDSDTSRPETERIGVRGRIARQIQEDTISRDILLFLIAFRILNALSIQTFFQPDEYFQSLEPAWQIAFGAHSGAWITWEWKHHLRSTIHPYLFAAVYKLSAAVSAALTLSPAYHAALLIVSPKVLQAVIAALGDYYTWKFGQKVYGKRSNEAWAALALTVCNPWQWFCSTRTLSNCLETTLTIVGMYLWPWEWSQNAQTSNGVNTDGSEVVGLEKQLARLRGSLLFAAVACLLRPTNVLIWACLACLALLRIDTRERLGLIRETALCGSLILAICAVLDRTFYGQWAFPPFRFLYFNIAQSLATFYGRNDWHYYVSQGFPLLLTTLLPFALTDIYNAIIYSGPISLQRTIRQQLAIVTILIPLTLSLISHKEVRFIYPLLPLLHILSSQSFTSYFLLAVSPVSPLRHTRTSLLRRFLLFCLLATNIAIATLGTQFHQPAPLSVLSYLRAQHETHYLTQPPQSAHIPLADTTMTVGFLMPCHSTPWRAHFIHPGIKAWALTCEPPIHLNNSIAARKAYRDEADQFYDNPTGFLKKHLGAPPRRKGVLGSKMPREGLGMGRVNETEVAWDGKEGKKVWPDYLVFFEQLEGTLKGYVGAKGGYVEVWRGWNSWGHDDWRRRGDVVVWCLRGEGESVKKLGVRGTRVEG